MTLPENGGLSPEKGWGSGAPRGNGIERKRNVGTNGVANFEENERGKFSVCWVLFFFNQNLCGPDPRSSPKR